jgi:hypothetical protein
LASECLKLSRTQKPIQQKENFSSFKLGHEYSKKRSYHFNESLVFLIFYQHNTQIVWYCLVSMMLPTGGSCDSSSIMQAEMKDIDQLCREGCQYNCKTQQFVFLQNDLLLTQTTFLSSVH